MGAVSNAAQRIGAISRRGTGLALVDLPGMRPRSAARFHPLGPFRPGRGWPPELWFPPGVGCRSHCQCRSHPASSVSLRFSRIRGLSPRQHKPSAYSIQRAGDRMFGFRESVLVYRTMIRKLGEIGLKLKRDSRSDYESQLEFHEIFVYASLSRASNSLPRPTFIEPSIIFALPSGPLKDDGLLVLLFIFTHRYYRKHPYILIFWQRYCCEKNNTNLLRKSHKYSKASP